MNRAAALAFGIPLAFTVALFLWREQRDVAPPPAPPSTTIPSRPTTPTPPPVGAPKPDTGRSDTVAGRPRVVDGDTIEIAGRKIRLNGIDAPESAQTCGAGERLYRCGDRATEALTQLLRDKVVTCRPTGTDQYQRTIGTCFLGDTDLGEWLVQAGLAVAFRRYSLAYVAAETAAKAARRGLWTDAFEMPWEYRARMRRERARVRE